MFQVLDPDEVEFPFRDLARSEVMERRVRPGRPARHSAGPGMRLLSWAETIQAAPAEHAVAAQPANPRAGGARNLLPSSSASPVTLALSEVSEMPQQ